MVHIYSSFLRGIVQIFTARKWHGERAFGLKNKYILMTTSQCKLLSNSSLYSNCVLSNTLLFKGQYDLLPFLK